MKKVILFLSLVLSSLMASAQDTPDLVCSTPYIAALPIDATSSAILWNSTAAASYTLQYRACSDTTWTTVNSLTIGTNARDTGRYVIQNLVSCKCYVARLRANCSANEVSDWRTYEFRTTGCVEPCRVPSGLFAAARETTASLNWSAGVTGSVYTVQWKLASSADWKTQTATTNSLIINDLLACNMYEFRVKSSCTNSSLSEFSVSSKFKTTGCVAPCSTPRELRAVVAADRSSAYFTWASTDARAYEVMYTAGDSAAQTVIVSTNVLRLTNVASCKTYKFKVRSICSAATVTSAVYSEWSTDISVNTEGCPRCLAPSRLSVVATDGGATLKWDAITGSLSYDIQWMGPNDTEWRTVAGVRENTYRLTSLATCSYYAFRVKANCTATSSSVWSSPMRFKTLGCAAVCAAPKDVRVYVSDSAAVVSWVSATAAGNYRLIVTDESGAVVREISVTGNSYTLTGLARCKKYKIQVKTVCSTTSLSEIVTVSFETRGCPTPCGVPREVAVQVDSNKVILKWSDVGATKYYIEYKSSADLTTDWKRDSSTGNALILSNLIPCKVYYFRIAAVCPNGVSAFTEPYRFTTTGCPVVCESPTALGSEIVNDTTASLKFNVIAGQSYTVQYRVAGTTAWTSVALNTATPNYLPIRITGLLKCTSYEWRVLRNCSATSIGESNTETFKTLGCPTTTCERTTGLSSQLISDTEATVKFTFIAGQYYTVQYRVNGTTAWTSIVLTAVTANNFPVRITGLRSCTAYQWRVLRNCSSTSLSESEVLTFTTTGCSTPCAAPRDLVINNYASDSAKFSWIMPATGLKYEVRYGTETDSSFLTATSTRTENNVVVLRGLVACRYYVAQVRTVCDNGSFSDWKTTVRFRVGANCLSIEPNSAQPNERVQYISEFGIYPNPGSDFVQVAYKLENEANVKLELMNLQGQIVSRFDGGNQEAGSYMQTLDNLSNVNTGIYLVVIRANGKVVDTQKWQKQ